MSLRLAVYKRYRRWMRLHAVRCAVAGRGYAPGAAAESSAIGRLIDDQIVEIRSEGLGDIGERPGKHDTAARQIRFPYAEVILGRKAFTAAISAGSAPYLDAKSSRFRGCGPRAGKGVRRRSRASRRRSHSDRDGRPPLHRQLSCARSRVTTGVLSFSSFPNRTGIVALYNVSFPLAYDVQNTSCATLRG